MDKVFEELQLSGRLPSASGVGLAILRQTTSEGFSLEELARSIQADPALTGRLLKLANAGNEDEPAKTVAQAATLLGVRSVRNVALGFTLVSGQRSGMCEGFDYDRYWSSSLACAVAAQVIGRWARAVEPAEAFTCALLSHIGQLALACIHPDSYSDVLASWNQGSAAELRNLESRAFDIDHNEVTVAMMAEWKLPESFHAAILEHEHADDIVLDEDVLDDVSRDMTIILRAAWRVAERCVDTGFDDTRHEDTEQELTEDLGRLGIPCEDAELVRAEIRADWREWSALLIDPGYDVPVERPTADATGVADVRGDLTSEGRAQNNTIRILAVDDDPVTLRLLKGHLEAADYEVVTADNGRNALQVALDQSPHIIVTDWIMPEMNGVELCKALRRFEPGRKMYILILTGREDEEQIVEGFQAGADDYVSKPFNPRVLLARVRAGQRMVELQGQAESDRRARAEMARDLGLSKRQLQGAVWTDFLTSLPNRRYAIDRLDKEWHTAVRTGKPLSVVMVDIDNFKRVNDVHGHDVGDIVLRETAHVLRRVTRRCDIVCRLGGEEFLVINVNSDLASAVNCAERLRKGVEANAITCASFEGNVTISAGVAELTPGEDVDALLKAADEAVYASKAAGRNTTRTSADVTRNDGDDEARSA